ncbi:AHI1 [Acanthosepion pharaonis]|uniref:AHI1 n=1 Tax=Acanthosepion pharaonis TaxID=158019 RepID=A0A812EIJ3_ACAPH|nr:AHI1 [Sepia pharaonis]
MTEDEDGDDITAQSRARFQQLLQENVEIPSRETKKKKKKMKPSMSTEESVMQQLKCLQKDEDPSISANTYNPKETRLSPKKKNLQQQLELSSGDNEIESPKKRTSKKTSDPKKRKSRPQPSPEDDQTRNEDEDLLISSPKEKPQKSLFSRKNKSKHPKDEDQNEEVVPPETTLDSPKPETKRNLLKKKKSRKKEIEEREADAIEQPTRMISDVADEGNILAISIHRTDKLKNDFHIAHPLVRVHIVNEETGQYLSKQNSLRAVTSIYEGKNSNVQHILPIMTQPFDFKQKKSTLPVWEDVLVFNENYNYFVQTEPKVILFFEILDFVGMNMASLHYSKQKQESGWYKIAWAFLKIVGANNKVNTGSKVRLQLFEPINTSIDMLSSSQMPEVYNWWKNYHRVNYPSTLYVTVKSMIMPQEMDPGTGAASQQEMGISNLSEMKNAANSGVTPIEKPRTLLTWSRLPGQTCRVPNSVILTLKAGRGGCYTVKFSNDGRSLACGCNNTKDYPVLIYEIPSGQLRHHLPGHFGIIYDLCWSPNDIQLCSASADGTVRVWNNQRPDEQEVKILPHPGYVYCCQFHIKSDSLVVTGGFDAIIRVWETHVPDKYGQLLQEIESHKGNINTLCFDELGEKLYSGDSIGTVLMWNSYLNNQPSETAFKRDWTFYKDISIPEKKGIPINCLKMHCSGRRLLVHYRDSIICMIDLRINQVMQEYIGALNWSKHIRSTLSPCGTLVFAGSEDNRAYVWHTDTGDKLEVYVKLGYQQPVTGIDYHLRDHIIAFSSSGNNQPVYVYKYDPSVTLKPDAVTSTSLEQSEADVLQASLNKTKSRSKGLASERNENFDILNKTRYEKAIKKLNSVSTLSPSMFSPLAHQPLEMALRQEQFFRENKYSAQSSVPLCSDHTLFNPFGSKLVASPITSRKKAVNTVSGSLQFSFETPKGAQHEEVVALYDYQAQRSDELNFAEGDILKVLYKDTEHWWMGESPSGQQGFFPSNYVEKAFKSSNSKKAKHSVEKNIEKSS